MRYLRIRLAKDFPDISSGWRRALGVDTANPNYRGKLPRVRSWLIEFDEDGSPWREIGLDEHDAVVLAGPSARDYGFWLDTGMRYEDFAGEPVAEEFFERCWSISGVVAP